jgi:hypothetical protein
MQHAHYRRSIAVLPVLLIVGGLLQGCGDPNWRPEQTDNLQVSQSPESTQLPVPSQNAECQSSEEGAISNRELERTDSLQVSPGSGSAELPIPSQNAECQSSEEATISWGRASREATLPVICEGDLLPVLLHNPKGAELKEDAKMPSLSRITASSTLCEVQTAVETYLERWSLESPLRRASIREQGQDILKNVESIKKEAKRSYKKQVLGFEVNDIAPLVWLQHQKATQEKLKALRGLRRRLLDACQFNSQELREAGIRVPVLPFVTVGDIESYSSCEEAQQISSQLRRDHTAFVVGVGKVLQGHIGELVALLDEAMDTNVAPYVVLLSSIVGLPDLLGDYTASLHETDGEREAELLGSLLAETILQSVALPRVKETKLHNIKHKLGQAAQRVAIRYPNQLKNLLKQKAPK